MGTINLVDRLPWNGKKCDLFATLQFDKSSSAQDSSFTKPDFMVHLRILLLALSACLTWQAPSGFLPGGKGSPLCHPESLNGSANNRISTPIGSGTIYFPRFPNGYGLFIGYFSIVGGLEVDMEMVGGFQSIPSSGPCIGMMIHGKNLRCYRVAVWDEN